MQCEICGATKGEFHQAIIEGSILQVCTRCSKFGAIIEEHPKIDEEEPKKADAGNAGKGFHYTEPAENIVDNFQSIVKAAREKKHLTQEQLANAVAEKESVIHKIEAGTLTPPIKTCKKLEQYLGIKLIVQEKKQQIKYQEPKLDFKSQKTTIGDLITFKFNADKK